MLVLLKSLLSFVNILSRIGKLEYEIDFLMLLSLLLLLETFWSAIRYGFTAFMKSEVIFFVVDFFFKWYICSSNDWTSSLLSLANSVFGDVLRSNLHFVFWSKTTKEIILKQPFSALLNQFLEASRCYHRKSLLQASGYCLKIFFFSNVKWIGSIKIFIVNFSLFFQLNDFCF